MSMQEVREFITGRSRRVWDDPANGACEVKWVEARIDTSQVADRPPELILGVDFTGRDDVVARAMMKGRAITTGTSTVALDPGQADSVWYCFEYALDEDDLEPLAIIGSAPAEVVSWFQSVEILWLVPAAEFDTLEPCCVMAANPITRWRQTRPDITPLIPELAQSSRLESHRRRVLRG